MNRCECLLVGVSEHAAHIVVEVWIQIRITERYVERIGVVRHRKELRGRRLRRTSEIEETDVSVVVELIVEHGLWRPVVSHIVIWIVPCGHIVGYCRIV